MLRLSVVLRSPTERSWSWAPHKKRREVADFPPLRVLFCGSDAFSVPTFNMLREMHLRRSDVVSDLSVITPVDKFSGRGMAVRKAAPMTILAKQMKYPVTHVHNFALSSSDLPSGDWDLIVAVSFGHKISSSVLDSMKAGGLNIHPSLLPRHRGPAPLYHAFLNGDKETGVSIQTIHPTEFDKGDILMQSPPVSLKGMNMASIYSLTARTGASMLKDLLLNGYPQNAPAPISSVYEDSYAGKISKTQMQVMWSTWTTSKAVRWSATLGSLWTELGDKVVKLHGLEEWKGSLPAGELAPGHVVHTGVTQHGIDAGQALLVRCSDGWIRIGSLTIAGKKERPGQEARELDGVRFKASD